MPYSDSVSEEVEGELIAVIEKLGRLKTVASKARTPAEVDAAIAEMRVTINRGMRVGHHWAKEDLKDVFNQGYRFFYKGPKVKKDVDASYNLRKKSRQAMNRLETGMNSWVDQQHRVTMVGKQLEAVTKAMPNAKGEDFVKLRKTATELRRQLDVNANTEVPFVTYFSKRGKHAAVAQMPAPTYIRMALRAGHVDNENQGVIRGAIQMGITELLVHDGDECGWSAHDATPLADGMVVSPQEAARFPKAHPNCQRAFSAPTKDLKKAAKAREAARKKAAQRAKAAQRKAKLQKAEQAARVATKIAITGVKAYRSPGIQLWINNIVQDRFNLPVPLREFAARFARYDTQERVVASSASMAEGKEVSAEEVRSRVLSWADDIRGQPEDEHQVPVAMQRILHLPPKASTQRINDATQSYGDWIARKTGEVKSSEENAADAGIWAQARERLAAAREGRTPATTTARAQHYHMSESRGQLVGNAFSQTASVLVNAYKKDWEEITYELVRSIAGNVDPLSWAKLSIGGDIRASLGTSAGQRRDLAGKIFKQVVDSRRYTAEDVKFAADYGVQLINKVTMEDVVRALIPRITFNPGGLMSFTVAMEDGKIVPAFRILPKSLIGRYFSYELTLASGAVGRIKALIDEGADIKTLLGAASEELISTINVFRNGPMMMNAQFWGYKFNGYGVYAQGDQQWIRFAARYRRYQRFAFDSFKLEELQQIAMDQGKSPGGTRAEIIQRLNPAGLTGAQVKTKVNTLWTEATLMPGGNAASVTFTGKNEEFDIIASLHNWSGSLVHLARELRADYAELKSWREVAKKRVGEYYQKLRPEELKSIRTLDDAIRYLKGFVDDGARSRAESVEAAQFTVGNHNVSPLLEHQASQALKDDLEKFNNAWDQLFPHSRRPNFDIAHKEEQRAELETRNGTIFIREDAARNWSDINHIEKRNEAIGFAPAGTGSTQGALWHEAGHYMVDSVPARGWDLLFERMKASDEIPKYIRARLGNKPEDRTIGGFLEKFRATFFGDPGRPRVSDAQARRWVRNNLSGYATANIHEFMAEAFKEFMTSRYPRPIAELIGDIVSRYGGEL